MLSRYPGWLRHLLSTARSKKRGVFAASALLLVLLASAFVSYQTGAGQQAALPDQPAEQARAAGGPPAELLAPQAVQPGAVAAAPPQFPSIGLGRGRADWERERGNSGVARGAWATYQNDRYWVQFKNGNIWHLDVHLSDAEALPLPNARAAISALLPPDAKRIKTYSPTENVVVDVYQSDWLAQQYGSVVWPRGSRPGTLIIRSRINDDLPGGNRVVWLGIEAGNDPAQNNP